MSDPQPQLVVRLRGLLRRRGEVRLSELRSATRLGDDAVERAVAVLVERGEVVVERHGRGYHARLAAA